MTAAQTASDAIALLHHLLPLGADELVHADIEVRSAFVEHLPDGDTTDRTAAVGGVGLQVDGRLGEGSVHQCRTVGGGRGRGG